MSAFFFESKAFEKRHPVVDYLTFQTQAIVVA